MERGNVCVWEVGDEGVSKIKNYRPGNNLCLKDKHKLLAY